MFLSYQKLLDACEEQNVDAYTDSVSACYLLPEEKLVANVSVAASLEILQRDQELRSCGYDCNTETLHQQNILHLLRSRC